MHHVIATAIITTRARVEERCWRGRELEVLSVTAGLAPFPRQPRQFQPVSHPTCFSSKLAVGLFSYWLFIFVQLTDQTILSTASVKHISTIDFNGFSSWLSCFSCSCNNMSNKCGRVCPALALLEGEQVNMFGDIQYPPLDAPS